MRRIDKRLPAGARIASVLLDRAEVLPLSYEERRKSRLRARFESGEEVALFLPHGTVLRDGDILLCGDGTLARVQAVPEDVLEITHADAIGMQRIAYHLGNRHVAVEITSACLRLADDSVLADLATLLGGTVVQTRAPFEPESGAYGGGHRHGHAETFEEDDALAKKSFAHHWTDQKQVKYAAGRSQEKGSGPDHHHPHDDAHGHHHDHADHAHDPASHHERDAQK